MERFVPNMADYRAVCETKFVNLGKCERGP